ncbi:MAG TPA: helix-turn-helix transcriptional regulator [Allosphingosinicella sp.]|nr:helix-turn-helix transcriptional regulator [Allosphingosinicella sp.]
MRRDDCGGCERRDACASLFRMLKFDRPPKPQPERGQERPSPPRKNPFLALLGEVVKAIEGKAAAPRSEFRAEVERRMEPLLASGPVRIDDVARALRCSRQTLYRRLKAEGVTFAELLDDLRRRLASRFVREQALSVKETAWRLGFSDPAAFSRAYKRWTGTSPSAARGKDRN